MKEYKNKYKVKIKNKEATSYNYKSSRYNF